MAKGMLNSYCANTKERGATATASKFVLHLSARVKLTPALALGQDEVGVCERARTTDLIDKQRRYYLQGQHVLQYEIVFLACY